MCDGRLRACLNLRLRAGGEKQSVKITGYVIDNMCAETRSTEAEAKNHSNSCALRPACEKRGYIVVSGDKTYKLNEQGNRLAAEALKTTKTYWHA